MHHRLKLVLIVFPAVFIYEYREHFPFSNSPFDLAFLVEVLIYGLIAPVLVVFMLSKLASTHSEWKSTQNDIALQRALRKNLGGVRNWEEAGDVVIGFVHLLVPEGAISLMVLDRHSASYHRIAARGFDGQEISLSAPDPSSEFCSLKVSVSSSEPGISQVCSCVAHSLDQIAAKTYYCLPLVHARIPIAMIHILPPNQTLLTRRQVEFLNTIAADIAAAVYGILHREASNLQRIVIQEEQHRIARDLHDTLGHKLAYMRLKLDQMTMDVNQPEVTAERSDLENLRDLCDQAYENMRDTLVALSPATSEELEVVLTKHASKIASRTNLDIQVDSKGTPRLLPVHKQREVFLIYREMLENIVKHARARHVTVFLVWNLTGVSLAVRDDGQGFDPQTVFSDEHLGLKFMRERAEEVEGFLRINSVRERGTEISLDIPYEV